MMVLYFGLLIAGLLGFVAHVYAQWRIARLMRQRYPRQWDIVARPEQGVRSRLRTWARFQQVLRADIPVLFDDPRLLAWYRCWRYAPWVAWPCWVGVLLLRLWHPAVHL